MSYDGFSVGAQTCGSKRRLCHMAAPISQVSLQMIFPMLKALEREGADEDFVAWARKPTNAKALMDWYLSRTKKPDLITVPSVSAIELVEQVKAKLRTTLCDEGLVTWDFVRDERGKTYEALTWAPGRFVSYDEVRMHFDEFEAEGNTAAFMSWVMERRPEGWWASVPSDDSRLFRAHDGLEVATFLRDDVHRRLQLTDLSEQARKFFEESNDDEGTPWFVAFREVK